MCRVDAYITKWKMNRYYCYSLTPFEKPENIKFKSIIFRRFMAKQPTSDIRMTYEYIQLTYE